MKKIYFRAATAAAIFAQDSICGKKLKTAGGLSMQVSSIDWPKLAALGALP